MLGHVFQKNWVRYIVSLMLLLVTLWCVLRPDYYYLHAGINYAQYILIGELILGVFFLIFRQPTLTFISFGCCALLCLFLKFNTNFSTVTSLPPMTDQPIFTVAHFNLSNSDPDPEVTFSTIRNCGADLISVQELTPLWDSVLHVNLVADYPYFHRMVDIGLYGMSVYSSQPILQLDTFKYRNIPNIIGQVQNINPSNKPIAFIVSHTMPALSSDAYSHLQKHLKLIASKCIEIREPLITLGQYNAVSWSNEIQNFREKSRLLDSRQLTRTQLNGGIPPFFEIPEDYIFYSRHFNCLTFETLTSENTRHLGIKATLQNRNAAIKYEQKYFPQSINEF